MILLGTIFTPPTLNKLVSRLRESGAETALYTFLRLLQNFRCSSAY